MRGSGITWFWFFIGKVWVIPPSRVIGIGVKVTLGVFGSYFVPFKDYFVMALENSPHN